MSPSSNIEVLYASASNKKVIIPTASIRLYSPIKILVASLIGGVIGGAILHWLNLKALRLDKFANWTVIMSLILVIGLPVALYLIHFSGSATSYVGGPIAAVYMFQAKYLYGTAYKRHAESQGKLGGWWATIGIGILSLVVSIFIAIPIGILVALVLHK